MVEQKHPITDAIDILHRRYYEGKPDRLASLEEERTNAEVAQAIYDLRTEAGLTQRQLATLVGTSASAIGRLEDADYEGHSLAMLRRIAAALGKRVELRFAPTQYAPSAVSIIQIHEWDEAQAFEATLKQYAQALVATLQTLGVQQKDIRKELKVPAQVVSGWAQGTRVVDLTQEQQLRTLLVKAATEVKQQKHDAGTVEALCVAIGRAMMALDDATLELEKAYSKITSTTCKTRLEAIESTLGFYAMEPTSRAKFQQARDAVLAAMDDLNNIWPRAGARNRKLKALFAATPTTQEDMPAYLHSMLDLLMKAFGKPDAGALPRKRGKRAAQMT